MRDASKLDRLLRLREQEEDGRTLELGLSQQAMRDAEEALRQLTEQRGTVERAMQDLVGESVGDVQTLRLLLEQLDRGIHNARTVRALAAATVKEKEERLLEARKRRETLERIVAPRHEEAEALERLSERKQEDEAALTRYRSRGQAAS